MAILEIPKSALGGAGPSSQELLAKRHRGLLWPAPTYSFSHTQRQRPHKAVQNINTAFQMCQESQAIPLSLGGQLEKADIQGTVVQASSSEPFRGKASGRLEIPSSPSRQHKSTGLS